MTTLKIDNGKIVDIDSGGYSRVIGSIHKNDYRYYFRRSPFTCRLSVNEEIQVCYIMDELNGRGDE